MRRLILFDVDGTLIDTAGAGRQALLEAFRTLFGDDGSGGAAGRVRFQGKTDPIIVREMARALGIVPDDLSRRRDEFWSSYLSHLRRILSRPDPGRRVLPGVRTALDDLARRPGVHLGLLTGNIEAGARAKLDAFGLNPYFPDGGFASDDADRRAIARLAREKLSRVSRVAFSPSATVVVGDTEYDVDCGRANGFRTVAVDSGWVPRKNLEEARPDAILNDFTDLPTVLQALGVEGPHRPSPAS